MRYLIALATLILCASANASFDAEPMVGKCFARIKDPAGNVIERNFWMVPDLKKSPVMTNLDLGSVGNHHVLASIGRVFQKPTETVIEFMESDDGRDAGTIADAAAFLPDGGSATVDTTDSEFGKLFMHCYYLRH